MITKLLFLTAVALMAVSVAAEAYHHQAAGNALASAGGIVIAGLVLWIMFGDEYE